MQLALIQVGLKSDSNLTAVADFSNFCRIVGMTKLKLFDKDPLDGKLRLTFRLMDSSSRHNLSAVDLVNYVRTIGLKMKIEDADHIIELMCGDEQSFFDEDSFVSFMKNEVSKL